MRLLTSGNIKMARAAIRSARWRSLLTMLGIIIGVVSVVTTVSLGEGMKQRVVGQINQSGSDLITVRPGRSIKSTSQDGLLHTGLFSTVGTGTLNEADLHAIQGAPGVKEAAPFAYVNGIAKTNEREYDGGPIIATSESLPNMLNQDLSYGEFFSKHQADRDVAVIGKQVAEQLFQENVPVGKLFSIRDQRFVVIGVFDEFPTSPLMPSANYNTTIFIPHNAGKRLNNGQSQLYQILARPHDPAQSDTTVAAITETLSSKHNGQVDFSVLKQEDNLAFANEVLTLLTSFIAGIAAISLIVGGIGILNIMLVSVTERTHEIGIRKAVGATNRQILGQFLTEAIILSLTGGLIGILLSLLVNYLLRILTDLTPVLTWPIMVVAVGVSVSVGVIFGITPALQAARKRPIEALRHE